LKTYWCPKFKVFTNNVTKKDSSERRVILDLSFPPGCSVNDNISKDIYLGEKIEVTYPNIDDLVGITATFSMRNCA
jgi:hypothetical protein